METTIGYIVISLIACVASFLAGYFLCKSRNTGLADNTGVCDKLSDSIEGSKDTARDIANRLGDLIESGSDIEAIFNKYAESTPEDKKLE